MQKHGGQNAEGLRVAQRKLPPLRMPTTSGAPPLKMSFSLPQAVTVSRSAAVAA